MYCIFEFQNDFQSVLRFLSWRLMSFSSHFLFFVLVDKCYEKQKYYKIDSFLLIFIFVLPYVLQTENIVLKITQPIFIFGNFINQHEKWNEKLINNNKEGKNRTMDFSYYFVWCFLKIASLYNRSFVKKTLSK